MILMRWIRGAAVAFAALNIAVPVQLVTAAEQTAVSAPAPAIKDIALGKGGLLAGRVVNSQGEALEGTEVVLLRGEKEVARTVTNDKGQFAVTSLKGGVYQMAAGPVSETCRLWSERTAPPSAEQAALVVVEDEAVRGQWGAVDPFLVLLTTGVVASVVVSSIALSEINSVSDNQDEMTRKLNNIAAKVGATP